MRVDGDVLHVEDAAGRTRFAPDTPFDGVEAIAQFRAK